MRKSERTRKKQNRSGKLLFIALLVVSFTVSTVLSYLYLREKFAVESSFIEDIESRSVKSGNRKKHAGDYRLYKSDSDASSIEDSPVLRKDTILVIAEDIIKEHMKPYEVRLLDLYMDKTGVIYIDFSSDLKKNFRGDVFEELNIIGGLYKRIKPAIPGFTALKILIQGREAESFGGHIDITKPIGGAIAEHL